MKNVLCTDPSKRFKIEDIRKHRWFNLVPQEGDTRSSQLGIIIGINTIPVNRKVINIMEEKYSVRREYAKRCLLENKHNKVTTLYYLLFQKYERLGMLSAEDEVDLLSDEEQIMAK